MRDASQFAQDQSEDPSGNDVLTDGSCIVSYKDAIVTMRDMKFEDLVETFGSESGLGLTNDVNHDCFNVLDSDRAKLDTKLLKKACASDFYKCYTA